MLVITDHAVLRWIERVYGIDLAAIRAEIRALAEPAASLGATKVSTNGVTIEIAASARYGGDKVVTTILPAEKPGVAHIGARTAASTGRHANPPSRAENARYQRREARKRR